MKKLQKALSLLLVVVLGISVVALGENAATGANNLVIKEVTEAVAVPQFYTPLALNGLNHVVYGYNDLQGKTQFRVYGELNGVLGFYPVNISLKSQDAGAVGLDVQYGISVEANLQAVTEDQTVAGVAKPAQQAPVTIPQGYLKWGNQPNLYYFTNAFGEKEYRLYATFDDMAFDFYPAIAETGAAVPGALAVDTQDDLLYMAKSTQYANKPATMANGWKQKVVIVFETGNYGVDTALPEFMTADSLPSPTPQIIMVTATPGTASSATKKPSTGTGTGGDALYQGSKGENVLLLTRRLTILGYMNGPTRTYDKNVTAAVKRFQRDYGLSVDGMAGDQTLKKINSLVPSTSYLSLNHSGSKVTELTRKLVKLGYLSQENSYFDKTVEQAVRSFQRDYGLGVDGIVGPNTERKLNAAASGTTPTDPYWALYSSRILRKGNSGEAVYQLSQRLKELGYLIYTSRTFDDTMVDAVKNFQLGQGLTADGIVGAQTLKALKNPQKPTLPTGKPFPTWKPTDFPTKSPTTSPTETVTTSPTETVTTSPTETVTTSPTGTTTTETSPTETTTGLIEVSPDAVNLPDA